ncbi:MAG: glycosyltransferase family 1 protein [bacterium]|nr:glycosyltransferase family 1 protein [bacterium]
MRICIDARWIGRTIAGIGRYTVYLLRYLSEMDGRNDYVALFRDGAVRDRVCGELGLAGRPRWEIRTVPYGPFSPRGQILLPRLLRRLGVDLFHSTNFMAPLLPFGGRVAVTIHDIIPLKFPSYAPRSKKRRLFPLYRLLMRRIAARADLIIADSACSRADILAHLSPPPSRVRIVPLGVDPKYRPLPAAVRGEVRGALGIRDRLALFAGRADPYKNLSTLVRAAETLNGRGRLHCAVAVAGETDPRYPEVGRYVAARGLGGDVLFLGSQDEEPLIRLYNAADLLAHPSLYEGFGLPPLEAMACGTPVVCSNRSSLPEVVGDAALLVEPEDAGALADAMGRVLTDGALRERMRAAGLERAKMFPWRRTAEETLALYNALA